MIPDDKELLNKSTPLTLRFLTTLSKQLPPGRISIAIALRVIRRLWTRSHQGSYVLQVWPGVKMFLNPEDLIGGMLAFMPQLFDSWEMAALTRLLPPDGTFVDGGANIGAYSLWVAQHCAPGVRILSIEADKENYDNLQQNIALNGFSQITTLHAGISDHHDTLAFYRNTTGNRGGHNFLERGVPSGSVECFPLSECLVKAQLNKIDVLKLDIEGFESKVLTRFFWDFPSGSPMRPTFMLIEIEGGQYTRLEKVALRQMILDNGYTIMRDEMNTLFRLEST